MEDGLGLTSITCLLVVVTSLTLSNLLVIYIKHTEIVNLGEVGSLAGLVLGHLVQSVLVALLALAVGFSFLRNVDHVYNELIYINKHVMSQCQYLTLPVMCFETNLHKARESWRDTCHHKFQFLWGRLTSNLPCAVAIIYDW